MSGLANQNLCGLCTLANIFERSYDEIGQSRVINCGLCTWAISEIH